MRLPFQLVNDSKRIERWLARLIRDLHSSGEAAQDREIVLARVYDDGDEYVFTLRYWIVSEKIASFHDMPRQPYGRLELSVTEHSPRDRSIVCRLGAWRGGSKYKVEYPRKEADLPEARASLPGTRAERRQARAPLGVRRAQDCLKRMGDGWLTNLTWHDVELTASRQASRVPDCALSAAEAPEEDAERGLSLTDRS